MRARAVAIGLVLELSGCGLSTRQQAAVQTFSTATLDFATVSSAEFVKSRTDVVEMNGLRMALGDRVDHGNMDASTRR